MRPSLLLTASALLCGASLTTVLSFSTGRLAGSPRFNNLQKSTKLDMFFASEAADVTTTTATTTTTTINDNVKLSPLDGSEASVYNAAKFMVDSFWLQSPQQLIEGGEDPSNISESTKVSLTNIQADDLMSKYGERMGKRKLLDALIVVASEQTDGSDGGNDDVLLSADEMVGLVTLEVRLLGANDLLSADESEFMLTKAVSSLGPKKRREYKDTSVLDIARELLPPEVTAVCSLSNLCTSPKARRRGIAAKLCYEAERLAKEELSFDEIFLRVEVENEAARKLYEDKLGYQRKFEAVSAGALRVDAQRGGFVEIESDIVVMSKKL
ncbi:hypothetical protein ACHAWC_001158 [Mediolabrus comicus]